ncbi:MAG: zinc-binding alcohol dehydrogenase family protein [SAR324 cluster bacterium]|nr:zinc-binding alcohol dehydrogenase family protein [SAR324 cluster bacterium]
MKAVVTERAGGPEVLEFRQVPRPEPKAGWVSIRVRAFGLNRSEWFTRRGFSPGVKFPRVLGIECVGEVVEAAASDLKPGQKVAAMMGGMGRQFDGSYAEFTLLPREIVFPIETELDWATFGALPEMLQTTHGSLTTGLEIERAGNLVVRGGTSSIGLAAVALAKAQGLEVCGSTRNPVQADLLKESGFDHVIVDGGQIAERVRDIFPGGADRVLELVGATTLLDSLRAVRRGGIVCMTGILGGEWVLKAFHPMSDVPTGVKLTSYSGESKDLPLEQFQAYVDQVQSGKLRLKLGPTFSLDEIQMAHRLMDENGAGGKIVVLVD